MKSLRTLNFVLVAAVLAACSSAQLPNGAAPLAIERPDYLPGHHTFHFTGAEQLFRVPTGVTHIRIVALGGNGGGVSASQGYGGRVDATVRVTPHERIYVFVGGDASNSRGGFNGGGGGGSNSYAPGYGGGGASDIRAFNNVVADRILVAGGGGGSGGAANYGTQYASGGKGGGLVADTGGTTQYYGAGQGGRGGSQHIGGAGGLGGYPCQSGSAPSGYRGTHYFGGRGAAGGSSSYGNGSGGGGGGGGYYGGGGGGAGCSTYSSYQAGGGGGGGGSSYVEASATKVEFWKGWKNGEHGLVVFDW